MNDETTADGGRGTNPPLHLEAWLSDAIPAGLVAPLARQYGEQRRGGELLNLALCGLVVLVFGCLAVAWITHGTQPEQATSVCTLCPQR